MANNPSALSILQLTDMHILPNPKDTLLGVNTLHYFQAVLDQALGEGRHFDLMLLTGDLAQDPCPASYRHLVNCLSRCDIPCLCLPGNHDDFELMQQILNTGKISCRKQLIFNHWQLICLNSQIPGSPGGRLSSEELSFLEYCLLGTPEVHALIAFHHHCLETKSAWMDTMIIENSQALFSIIKHYPQVKAITTGHVHQCMDRQKQAVRVLATPSTCFQFTPESKNFSVDKTAPGFRILELYPDGRIESDVGRLPGELTGLQIPPQGY